MNAFMISATMNILYGLIMMGCAVPVYLRVIQFRVRNLDSESYSQCDFGQVVFEYQYFYL